MAGYYTLKKTTAGQYMFNLHAGNRQIIFTSESYKAKASALGGVESVRLNALIEARFERKIAADGQPYFVLKAANGEPIGHSEMYSRQASMEKGIRSVMSNAAATTIRDLS